MTSDRSNLASAALSIATALFISLAVLSTATLRESAIFAVLVALCIVSTACATVLMAVAVHGLKKIFALISSMGAFIVLCVGILTGITHFSSANFFGQTSINSLTTVMPVAMALLIFGGVAQFGAKPAIASCAVGIGVPLTMWMVLSGFALRYPILAILAGLVSLAGLGAGAWQLRHYPNVFIKALTLTGFIVAMALVAIPLAHSLLTQVVPQNQLALTIGSWSGLFAIGTTLTGLVLISAIHRLEHR